MGVLNLGDALALCVVIAERDPAKYDRAATRWISRFIEETPDAALEELQLLTAAPQPRRLESVFREFVEL
jgi:hypothetical protein